VDAAGLLALYRACHYAVRLPGGRTRATLRVDEPVPQALNDWLAEAPFGAFITAYNPRSIAQPASENRAAQQALLDTLRTSGARVLPGAGRIPGQSWREPSLFVAGPTLTEIDALACRHSQNAIVLAHGNGLARLRSYPGF
jgi:hypothetical protein